MGAGILVLEVIIVFFLALLLLDKYGNWRQQHFFVTIATFVGWFFSFIIIFILPLDIAIVSFTAVLCVHFLAQYFRLH